jgi:hypothetical protein
MREQLSQQFARKEKKRGWFRNFLKKTVIGVEERHACSLVAVMITVDKRIALDGMIMAVAHSGMLFRQASTFVFDRHGQTVVLRYAGVERAGQIETVSEDGYWVRLTTPLDASALDDILQPLEAPTADAA